METQRLISFFVLSFAIMLGWAYVFAPPPKKRLKKGTLTRRVVPPGKRVKATKHSKVRGVKTAKNAPSSRPTSMAAASQPASMATTRTAPRVAAATRRAAPKKIAAQKTVPLKTVSFDDPLYKATLNNRGGVLSSLLMKTFYEPKSKAKKKPRLDLFDQHGKETLKPFSERFLDGQFVKHDYINYDKVELVAKSPAKVKFTGRLRSKKGGFIEIEKTYTFEKKRYAFRVDYLITNRTSSEVNTQVSLGLHDYKDPKTLKAGGWFSVPDVYQLLCKVKQDSRPARYNFNELAKSKPYGVGARYAAVDRRYFITAIAPHWNAKDGVGTCTFSHRKNGYVNLDIRNKGTKLATGATFAFHYTGYAGPKYYNRLSKADKTIKLESTIDFGIFAFLCRPMLWLLQFFYSLLGTISLANWGIAIILLTLLIKLITYPLTKTSMKSMKNMQKLKPELDKLKEKYGDDKESIQRETMNLYMKEGINPLAGCLPMLVQMPIWLALYNTLFYSVELYQAPFIPGWIMDLSSRDPFYILPVMLGASMFLQQRLTPQTGMDPMQQKIMSVMMPAMFTFFMFFLPAGLTLYIFVNTILSVLHQWHIYNTPDDDDAKPKKKSRWMERMKDAMEQQKAQSK